MQVVIAVSLATMVLAQRQQQSYLENEQGLPRKQQAVDDQRPLSQDRYTTPIPIIRFDKEQGADGSYKTRYDIVGVR
jgi:hypothetical protein